MEAIRVRRDTVIKQLVRLFIAPLRSQEAEIHIRIAVGAVLVLKDGPGHGLNPLRVSLLKHQRVTQLTQYIDAGISMRVDQILRERLRLSVLLVHIEQREQFSHGLKIAGDPAEVIAVRIDRHGDVAAVIGLIFFRGACEHEVDLRLEVLRVVLEPPQLAHGLEVFTLLIGCDTVFPHGLKLAMILPGANNEITEGDDQHDRAQRAEQDDTPECSWFHGHDESGLSDATGVGIIVAQALRTRARWSSR